MNIIETGEVMALITAYNQNFKVDRMKIAAWADILQDYPARDCRAAVKEFFKTPGDWIMPADIIERVERYREDRLKAFDGTLYLNPADDRRLVEQGGTAWREASKHLHNLAKDGLITPQQYEAYQDQKLSLTDLGNAAREITR